GEVFVVTPNSNSTAIISDSTYTTVATVPAGPGPFEIAYDSAKGEMFISNPQADAVTVVSDAATATSTTSAATTTSTTSTTSSSAASSSSMPSSYLAVAAINVTILAILGVLRATGGRFGSGHARDVGA
ncbi:MAG: hypothetical protein ABSF83_07190, partial [Nitrososphaerales archaeon]